MSALFPIAHVASDVTWSTSHAVFAAGATAFLGLLLVEHLHVKHGGLRFRHARTPLAALVALALTAAIAPTPGFAQGAIGPSGLPDLVSDPSFIWIEQVRTHPVDGSIIRTISFDGILHNLGPGALDLAGNPQVDGGVKQRVFDGETWEDVGEPFVQFETDDGHNHFHLMNAAGYSLWNEAQTEEVDIGAKVGFCLLDTQQIERGVDAAYLIDEIKYCNVDEPDATYLNMGISPGWVDVYEASVTFQWIDVSATLPGRYWVGAVMDPNNQIVEENEENNDVVFSSNKYAVSGYNARPLEVQGPGDITLKSTVYGTVGQVAYVIVDEPAHGSLSVPAGFDILDATVQYIPDVGYAGTDSFSYYAQDTDSAFPFEPEVVTVQIDTEKPVTGQIGTAEVAEVEARLIPESSAVSATRFEIISLPVQLAVANNGGTSGAVAWYAKDLPTGLVIDPATGVIQGELTMPAEITSQIIATVDGTAVETEIDWAVQDAPRASLRHVNDFSTVLGRRDITVGAGSAETNYEATGLPDGMILTAGQPSILGVPTEAGVFEVTVNELREDEVVDSVTFTLTVRPSATPKFAL